MRYGCQEDFQMNVKNLLQNMKWFDEDYKDICKQTEVMYDDKISNKIMNYLLC